MKKITLLLIILLSYQISYSQVAIGKTSTSSPSVSLEFADFEYPNPSDPSIKGNGRGLILPWVSTQANIPNSTYSGITNTIEGSLIYDINDKKVKVYKITNTPNTGDGLWQDLSIDTTGVVDLTLQNTIDEKKNAKVNIGSTLDNTDGILVLSDTEKAMVLPKMPSPHLNIINPEPGTIAYDTDKKLLCIFNGSVWTFWEAS